MAELAPALATALAQQQVGLYGAVTIAFASATLRLLDGSGQLLIAGQTYSGMDATWGALGAIKGLSEQTGDNAPGCTIDLLPPTTTALSSLLDPALQGAAVQVAVLGGGPPAGAWSSAAQAFAARPT